VLPDQRVVLYQKCTETLLNTWHTWKFRGEETQNRSRTEKQHRARLEAIAFAMHTALEGSDPSQRAVASEADLLEILSGYIETYERLPSDRSRDVAVHFLHFVRERAGLIIEVGQGHYGFLHLTFQEYLAATYLRKSGELAGIREVWGYIKTKCGNSLWHEVIRLLIGSLEMNSSQRFFLEEIICEYHNSGLKEHALLAGGCLLDRVTPAEEMAGSILRAVLEAAIRAESNDDLQKPLRQLILLEGREADLKKAIFDEASRLYQEKPIREPLDLILVALGWTDREIRDCHSGLMDAETDYGRLFGLLLSGEHSSDIAYTEKEHERICLVQYIFSIQSLYSNLASIALCSAFSRDPLFATIPGFAQLLCALTSVEAVFRSLLDHAILIRGEYRDRIDQEESDFLQRLQESVDLARTRAPALDLNQA
jgi:hypothetical protein